MKITVNVPATTANLGPGFDCLGLALDWWNTIVVESAPRETAVRIRGLSEGLPADPSNVTWRAMAEVFQRVGVEFPRVRVTMTNRIPIGRGLGSSAAAIVGGLVAANAWYKNRLSQDELLALATEIEGHPDNVSAALIGGMTIVIADGARLVTTQIIPPPTWRAVLFVPEQALSTKFAREILPKKISRADAVFNIGRAALLTYAMMASDGNCLRIGTQDRLHQPYRESLVVGMPEMLEAARQAGAAGVALSGAGPSLIAFTTSTRLAKRVAETFTTRATALNLPGTARIVRLSERGAHIVG